MHHLDIVYPKESQKNCGEFLATKSGSDLGMRWQASSTIEVTHPVQKLRHPLEGQVQPRWIVIPRGQMPIIAFCSS